MKHKFQFTKMHGLGNDFILVDAINQRITPSFAKEISKEICSRHFGVGADGLILVYESEQSDFAMRIFNADGSEPEMCGNGIRCFAKFVYDNKLTQKDVITVETLAGIMVPGLIHKNNQVESIEVDMGEPILTSKNIPIETDVTEALNHPIKVLDKDFEFTGVSMGNPHAIFFSNDLKEIPLNVYGPEIESHPLFPNKTNVEFVQVLNKSEAVMIVWERGAAETMACGTGACATVVAGVLNKKLERKSLIHLPGGDLQIEWQESDNHVVMTGPASTVYSGEIEIHEKGETQ